METFNNLTSITLVLWLATGVFTSQICVVNLWLDYCKFNSCNCSNLVDSLYQDCIVLWAFALPIIDIKELLSEIFQQAKVNFTLESRVKVAPRSANEVYTIALKAHGSKMKVSWPEMKGEQSDVFQNVKRLMWFSTLSYPWWFFITHIFSFILLAIYVLEK